MSEFTSYIDSGYSLPLKPFFDALRKQGFELGVKEYEDFLKALSGGYGLRSIEDLKELCRKLWYKPGHAPEIFDRIFERSWRDWQPEQDVFSAKKRASNKRDDVITPKIAAAPKESAAASKPTPQAESVEPEKDIPDAIAEEFIISLRASKGTGIKKSDDETSYTDFDFSFNGAYQPSPFRTIKLNWRHLRHGGKKYQSDQPDINETIYETARQGHISIKYQTEVAKEARLLILVDRGGSMVAFQDFVKEIIKGAPENSFRGNRTFYFHDVPTTHIYADQAFRNGWTMEELRTAFLHRNIATLIISDAGAARGTLDRGRVQTTSKFLEFVNSWSTHAAWLNPMPAFRWRGTSAEHINSPQLPMFDSSPRGISQMIEALRGRYKYGKTGS